MKRYIYTAKFDNEVTTLKIAKRICRITLLQGEKFLCEFGEKYEKSLIFPTTNSYVLNAFNGFILADTENRGVFCYSFLNMLNRMYKAQNHKNKD